MKPPEPLAATALRWRCDPEQFDFQTTHELDDFRAVLGQERAMAAVQFSIGMRRDGYNLYVLGPPGIGKRTIVARFLQERSAAEPTPDDWCYVNNFEQAHKPRALRLPPGRGVKLRNDMLSLVEDSRTAIPAALAMEEHQNQTKEIEDSARQKHEEALQQFGQKCLEQGVQLIRTPGGFGLAPMREGEVLDPKEFEALPLQQQQAIEHTIKDLQEELQHLVEQIPQLRKAARDKIKELNREATRLAIGHLMQQIKQDYADLPDTTAYLNDVEQDVIDNADDFRAEEETPAILLGRRPQPSFARYSVNLLVDNSSTPGAPVVFEDHPTYQNLLGRMEHESHMGTLTTDFTLLKPGALHRANGGYLVVEALRLLREFYAWEGLKRAIESRRIKTESLAEALSLLSTASLEPEPVPLDVKVVLLGERLLYYLLYHYDRDFAELFKVAADFDDRIERTEENCRLYAQLIGALIRREEYLPFDRSAVARVLEHSAREAEDAEKLTTHMRTIADLLRESDYWATLEKQEVVEARHVQTAIDNQIYRADRVRERVQEEIQRGVLLIDTDGEQAGQVNGLSVLDLGSFRFGRPSRITATVRLGKGEVVDVEREVELGGAIHSKGVLILSSFLAARYAKNYPLSLSASLVFEQSYGMVEGDSASVGELAALLSALADAPILQSLAVTGSVNQHGRVQPIGGVNEKIEGFFDVCRQRGLTGKQGVLIPAANVKHLMLRHDVVQAAAEGKFQVYAISTVDEAIALLTGVPAGERGEDGEFPPGTINQRVEARLLELLELRQKHSKQRPPESRPDTEPNDE